MFVAPATTRPELRRSGTIAKPRDLRPQNAFTNLEFAPTSATTPNGKHILPNLHSSCIRSSIP